MSDEKIEEWTLDGVLDEIAAISSSMKDRQFAFILGAGASFTSGIPTGKTLAETWLREMHRRECIDDMDLEAWIRSPALGIDGLSLQSAAEFYPKIFERRFRYDREAGYAALERAMEGKSPSLGYSLLAEIIQHSRHNVIVTTNFDNLVADALAMHAHRSPLVVAHESLAGFVRPQLRRPLIAKIHRDLFFEPQNDEAGVGTLDKAWTIALRKLFQYFTPIVIGYGGNDGSLMGLLESLDVGEISGRMIWCYRDAPPNGHALNVLRKHRGIQVKIPGFDDFMLRLADRLMDNFNVAAISDRIESLGVERSERYREQFEELQKTSAKGSEEQRKTGKVLSRSVGSGKSWWSWELMARDEPDFEKRNEIYRQGLSFFPNSGALTGSYARFIAERTGDYETAEKLYKKALELSPDSRGLINDYAAFLVTKRGDPIAAELLYDKAIERNVHDVRILSGFANFIERYRKDHDRAEALYRRALELDPTDKFVVTAFATFLGYKRNDIDGADIIFKRLLEIDPDDANSIARYATFVANRRDDYELAETLFKRALVIAPENVLVINRYGDFLENRVKDYDAAEGMYKKALELDSNSIGSLIGYATLLAFHRKDYDAAEPLYRKALDLSQTEPILWGGYATCLAFQRKDTEAQQMYERAIQLDSEHANSNANYVALLLGMGGEIPLKRISSLLGNVFNGRPLRPSQVHAEALLYDCILNELNKSMPDNMFGRLKWLLEADFFRGYWDFSRVFESVLPNIDPDKRDLYLALGAAILDSDKMLELDDFELWRNAKAVDPNQNSKSGGEVQDDFRSNDGQKP